MADSVVIEWLEENSYRAYPLQEGAANIFTLGKNSYDIYAAIVDANLAFSVLPTTVTLDKIVINGTTLTLYISGQNTFSVTLSAQDVYYVRNSSNSLLVLNGSVVNQWSGLQTFCKFTNLFFEPSVCYELSPRYLGVSGIHFGSSLSAQNWTNGYQFSVVPNGQSIQLEVGRNEGYTLPCGDFRDSTGLLSCDNVVHNINGATPVTAGGSLTLTAGPHVQIFNDPQRNAIFIGFDFVASDIGTDKLLPP